MDLPLGAAGASDLTVVATCGSVAMDDMACSFYIIFHTALQTITRPRIHHIVFMLGKNVSCPSVLTSMHSMLDNCTANFNSGYLLSCLRTLGSSTGLVFLEPNH